eukprot:gnl/TRDRNA2_/TRDRNA2_172943_c0_seq4.p1 gnl/TRDRNA2_/TRDRNA2_172943_c0~~gnl/TRDRNA2_/TRDRNA2_172943_c0_seq4.p1  ORF type:complete len:308 (+),score=116.38 gnl/TRDRNA2_/TRDRNA2_172943_c0_seq4:348-1271(+)
MARVKQAIQHIIAGKRPVVPGRNGSEDTTQTASIENNQEAISKTESEAKKTEPRPSKARAKPSIEVEDTWEAESTEKIYLALLSVEASCKASEGEVSPKAVAEDLKLQAKAEVEVTKSKAEVKRKAKAKAEAKKSKAEVKRQAEAEAKQREAEVKQQVEAEAEAKKKEEEVRRQEEAEAEAKKKEELKKLQEEAEAKTKAMEMMRQEEAEAQSKKSEEETRVMETKQVLQEGRSNVELSSTESHMQRRRSPRSPRVGERPQAAFCFYDMFPFLACCRPPSSAMKADDANAVADFPTNHVVDDPGMGA